MTLPLAVLGSSGSVPSSPTNHTHAGAFYDTEVYEHKSSEMQFMQGYGRRETNLGVHAFRNSPPHFVAINVSIRLAHDPCADYFTVFGIWDRNYGGFPYGRILG